MKLPTQEIVAFTGVFLWGSFWLNGGRVMERIRRYTLPLLMEMP